MKNTILIIITLIITCSLPSQASIIILNGLTHSHTVSNNAVTQGKIILKNEGSNPERVMIYQEDIVMDCETGVNFSADLVNANSLRPFLKTSIDDRVLLPGEEYVVFYDIDVTNQSLANGTYWSIIMVEGADPVKEEEQNNVKINSVVRYAVQIIADLGVFQGPEIGFESVTFEGMDDSLGESPKFIKVKLRNQGHYSSRVELALELYNEQGEPTQTLKADSRRMYPEGCAEFMINLEGLETRSYNGVMVADSGSDLFGANISFEMK